METDRQGEITRKNFIQQLGLGIMGTGIFFPAAMGATEFLSSRTKNPKKIVVIGGGLAGLSAALELKAAGHEVILLEARNRPGGRVSTIHEPFSEGLYAEEGAAAFSENYTYANKLIEKYALEKVPLAMPEDAIVYHLNGQRIVAAPGEKVEWPYKMKSQEQGMTPFALVQKYIIETLPDEVGNPKLWDQAPVVSLDKISLAEYLRKQGASEGAVKLLQNTQWFASVPEETSGLSMAVSDFGLFMGGMPFILKDGNDMLPKEMAKQLLDNIQYDTEVKAIQDSTGEVKVTAIQNDVEKYFSADQVIVALPLKVLKNINFDPGLPSAKITAIDRIPALDLTKVYMEVDKPFWMQEGLSGLAFTDLSTRQVNPYLNADDPENNTALLETYVAGKLAGELGKMEEGALIDRQSSAMEKVHPNFRKHFNNKAYIKAWSEDPFALGGPSWPSPGDVTCCLRDLQEPHGRIHFAGEHTSILRSTMEGALRSGSRAAKAVEKA